jgi:hypothetical protein
MTAIAFVLVAWLLGKTEPMIVGLLHGTALSLWPQLKPFIALAVAMVVLVISLGRYSSKRKRHVVAMGQWENTWMCLQCGGMWT